jgi:pimeloyl-ACP methyl ester carboxylesterase
MSTIHLARTGAVLTGTVTGEGPTALLLHAGGERRRVWEPVAAHLAVHHLGSIAYDLRGHGDSTGEATSLPILAADVGAMIRHASRPLAVVGSSIGGLAAIAALASADIRRRVAGLVLVDVVPDPPPERTLAWLDEHGLTARRPELIHDVLGRGADLLEATSMLTCPITLVRGGVDSPLHDEDVARLRAAAQCFEVVDVPSAGHLVARDAPAELASIVARRTAEWLTERASVGALPGSRAEGPSVRLAGEAGVRLVT